MSTSTQVRILKSQMIYSVSNSAIYGERACEIVYNLCKTNHLDNRILETPADIAIGEWVKSWKSKWACNRRKSDLYIFYDLDSGKSHPCTRANAIKIFRFHSGHKWIRTTAEGL